MYKVFVKDIPIILSTEKNIGKQYTAIPLKLARFKKLIKKINNGELIYVNLYHKNPGSNPFGFPLVPNAFSLKVFIFRL